jgi:hypothetical protein
VSVEEVRACVNENGAAGVSRPHVRADGSGVNSGRVDGVRLYGLHGEVAECRGGRECMR